MRCLVLEAALGVVAWCADQLGSCRAAQLCLVFRGHRGGGWGLGARVLWLPVTLLVSSQVGLLGEDFATSAARVAAMPALHVLGEHALTGHVLAAHSAHIRRSVQAHVRLEAVLPLECLATNVAGVRLDLDGVEQTLCDGQTSASASLFFLRGR